MPSTVSYSGIACASGVVVPFSGIALPLNQQYLVEFTCISRMPESNFSLKPTGFLFTPSQRNSTVSTLFSAKNNVTLQNSSSNIIKLSIYSGSSEIYRDYSAVYCGNLSNDPVQIVPTPTPTPTITLTPTITPTATRTPTPTQTPPLTFSAAFPSLVNSFNRCGQVVVTGVARGILNHSYTYSFTSDMSDELVVGNQTGIVTITQNPTYVYTTILLQDVCKNYSLKFGLSDGNVTVQSIGFFRCGSCSN
jgi:hypothetical protein